MLRQEGKDEKRMKQDREKMSRTGYSFISNAAWHWREQFTREPKAAASVLLLSFVAICLPLLNARLPKLVLQGLEERWELMRFAAVLLLLVAVLAVANMLQAALKAYMRRMQGPFEDDFNLRLLKKRLRVDYELSWTSLLQRWTRWRSRKSMKNMCRCRKAKPLCSFPTGWRAPASATGSFSWRTGGSRRREPMSS